MRKLFFAITACMALSLASTNSAIAKRQHDHIPLRKGDCVPHTSPTEKGWFEIEGVQDVFAQSWEGAHYQPWKVFYLAGLTYRLREAITVDGTPSKLVQITFYPSDNQSLVDCSQTQQADREAYWQQGYFHFVEKSDDPDFPKVFNDALTTDFSKNRVCVYLNPKDVPGTWYQIRIESKPSIKLRQEPSGCPR